MAKALWLKTGEWKRRHGNLWEFFIDGQRKGGVKCLGYGRNNESIYSAKIGGASVRPGPDDGQLEGCFTSLYRAKKSVEMDLEVLA
jgi:hypothetical protein